ncbi:hypothetical protein IWQ62_002929 [Dispira parvispora]|uniref:5'-nucleotidase n=1 Tax=Dispira parvispora TaxID=1520584 RepID=A0A9W8E705_9FUNG|nr:hypothetical protein IWQ62_002929 [Dispira parvispora]
MNAPSGTSVSLSLVHFNDVYHINASNTSKEPVGGAARFVTLVNQLRLQPTHQNSEPNPINSSALVVFSGDAFNPSTESSFTRGKHMVPVLNALNLDAACYGNHDFDFGVTVLESLARACNFPWLLSNVVDCETGQPVARAQRWHLVEHQGLKIGFIGIVEREWLETLPSLPATFQYRDFVECARELSEYLRSPAIGVDLVVALTHMRLPNDIKLARECADQVDLVLGGHDHMYAVGTGAELFGWTGTEWTSYSQNPVIDTTEPGLNSPIFAGAQGELPSAANYTPNALQGLRIVKSGTDFRELSEIQLRVDWLHGDDSPRRRISQIRVYRHAVTSDILPDPATEEVVQRVSQGVSKHIDKVIGYTLTPWDARSTKVRIEESAIGNLLADLMRNAYPCVDVALACGGAIRSDTVYGPGDITMRTVMDLFPFEDPVVVVRLSGTQLWEALENGFSKFPAQEGRFPQVSGLCVRFDPRKPPGERVVDVQILTNAKRQHQVTEGKENRNVTAYDPPVYLPLDREAYYNVATRKYMATGRDGYTVLTKGEEVVDDENGVLIATLFRRYFLGLKYTRAFQFKQRYLPRLRDTRRVRNKLDGDRSGMAAGDTQPSTFTLAKVTVDATAPIPSTDYDSLVDDSGLSSNANSLHSSPRLAGADLSLLPPSTLERVQMPDISGQRVASAVEEFSRNIHNRLTKLAQIERQADSSGNQVEPRLSTNAETNDQDSHRRKPSVDIDTESVHSALVNSCVEHTFSPTRILKYACSHPHCMDESVTQSDDMLTGIRQTRESFARVTHPLQRGSQESANKSNVTTTRAEDLSPAKQRWRKLQVDILVRKVLGKPQSEVVKSWCTVAPSVEGRIINLARD